jgi:hypothetical protein
MRLNCHETVFNPDAPGPENFRLRVKAAAHVLQYLVMAKAVLRLSVSLVSSVRKTWDSWSNLQYST